MEVYFRLKKILKFCVQYGFGTVCIKCYFHYYHCVIAVMQITDSSTVQGSSNTVGEMFTLKRSITAVSSRFPDISSVCLYNFTSFVNNSSSFKIVCGTS